MKAALRFLLILGGVFFLFIAVDSAVFLPTAQAATFTVNVTDDPPPVAAPNGCNLGGRCSLREAVLAANNSNEPNTILLGEEIYHLTLPEANSPETGDLNFTGPIAIFNVTLQGAGQDKTFIVADPGLNERVLDFNGNFITVTISDLTIQNGNGPGNGGGARVVASNATTTIKNVTFLDNKAGADGGGLYCVSGTTTTHLQNVNFSGNQAAGLAGAFENGGSNITLGIDGGTYSDNQAGTSGGALYLFGTGVAPSSIKNIIVNNNRALNGNGGGIHRDGFTPFSLNIDNVQVTNNSADNPGDASGMGLGGGLYISPNDQTDVNAVVKNSLIRSNTAAGNSSMTSGGGGLWIGDSKLFQIVDCSVENNQALNGKSGGGLFFDHGGIQVLSSTFSGNSAGEGGGLKINASSLLKEVTNSTLSGNHADNLGGGLSSGGAVAVTLNNVTVTLNTAGVAGAGISNTNFSSPINLQNSIFAANNTNDGSGQTDDCAGSPYHSLGFNVFASPNNSGCTTDGVSPGTATNDTTSDPHLGPLQNNGGPTATHALLAGSSALDGGNPSGCTDQSGNLLGTDQRGVFRPQGLACDIGSYEVDSCESVVCAPTSCTSASCNPETGECEFTPLANGTPCDDGNACTQNDSCQSGFCQSESFVDCDDHNLCTADSCNPGEGCNHTPINVDDGNACTMDSCDPSDGVKHTPITCDDANACNGVETCNPSNGQCVPGTPIVCGDGNACNGDETCNPSNGNCIPGTPVICGDGSVCNGTETCNPSTGNCDAGTPLHCDDNNVCNGGETCDLVNGCQPGTPLNCQDGDACNGVEICHPAVGCQSGIPADCEDNDPCTADSCDSVQGCRHDPLPDGDNDGICDANDACPVDPDNDVDLDGVCGDVDNCPDQSNPDQADSDNDGIGDACDEADQCDCCAKTTLTAEKSYNPISFEDGEFCGCRPVDFQMPLVIEVKSGNAGNQTLNLTVEKDGQDITCRYRGGAPKEHPTKPLEVALGRLYVYDLFQQNAQCLRSRLFPGTRVATDHILMHINNGDSKRGTTVVEMPVKERASSGCDACDASGGAGVCE